jgi:hypothetical protein
MTTDPSRTLFDEAFDEARGVALVGYGEPTDDVREDRYRALTARLILVPAEAERDDHVIEFCPDGWTIMHPLSCRPNLFACAVNRDAVLVIHKPAYEMGRFACFIDEGGDFAIGDRVDGGPDV